MTSFISPTPVRWLVVLLLGIILTLDVASMRHMTVTYDEPTHFRYGQNVLNLDSNRFNDSTMPVTALNALPARLGVRLSPGPLETGRYVTVLFSLLVALCVFAWARDLYGPTAGLLALTLYTFDPSLLAHSQLVTTDLYALGMMTFSLYFFWRFLQRGGWSRAMLSGVVLGVSQLVKYTAVFLFPLFAVIAIGFYAPDMWRSAQERRFDDLRRRLARFSGYALLFLALSLMTINAGFLFDRTFTPLADFPFRSDLFRSIQSSLAKAGTLPVPVPYPYLDGLDWIAYRERTGDGYGNIYLLGEVRTGEGFSGYYFYAFLYKVPIATQLVLLAAIGAYVARFRRFDFLRNEWVLICPILFFTVQFNFFYRAQIGIRHFLIVFPLLYILSGSLLKQRPSLSRWAAVALTGAIACLPLSVLSYYPHFLPYFNELVWDRTQAYKILADSNLDWGQHVWYFQQYMAAHPEVIVEPAEPTAGTILVGVNVLTGVAYGPEKFRWLRENFKPVGHVAYSVLVFKVSPADLERIKLASTGSSSTPSPRRDRAP